MTARRLIERVTRSWVYRRNLPAAFNRAPIVATPSAGLKYLFKSMSTVDPPLLRNAEELVRPNDVVWDIGANIGLFTFAAAALSGVRGTVVAFEPDVWLVQLLRRSRRLQPAGSAPVTIIPAAAASQIALRQFKIAQRSRALNSLSDYDQTGRFLEEHSVPAFNLDWLLGCLPAPNVIKCDVEGAEIEVFCGQRTILSALRPIVICEVGSETSLEMSRIFLENHYALYNGEQPIMGATAIKAASWSTVAIPDERCAKYVERSATSASRS
jgi:FkbM family methyltransferase